MGHARTNTKIHRIHAKSNPGDSSSLLGVWRLDLLQTGNVNRTTFFLIKKGDSAKYQGTVTINGAVDLPFRKIRFEGAEFVFSPGWNRDYRLRMDGDRMHVTIAYAGGGSTQGFAVRVPIETTYPPRPIPFRRSPRCHGTDWQKRRPTVVAGIISATR